MSGRRADLVALGGDGEIWIVEIKSSVEDFRADQKWTRLSACIATACFLRPPRTFRSISSRWMPGSILADGYGAELVREAPEHRLHAGTRKSVMLAFARAASLRLQAACDPQGPYAIEF